MGGFGLQYFKMRPNKLKIIIMVIWFDDEESGLRSSRSVSFLGFSNGLGG